MTNPLYDLIARGESDTRGYNAYNRGTYRGEDGRDHMRKVTGPIDFSTMTLGQVQDRQHLPRNDENRLFAVGRYQLIPETMDEAVTLLHLDRNQPFTPQLQDRIFSEHLIVNKRPAVHDYIVGKPGATLEKAQHALAREWASFGDPDNQGSTHYPTSNRASITTTQSANALNQMRQEYQTNIAKGISPDAAWQAVTAIDPQQRQTQVAHLRQGSHGQAVTDLQTQLQTLGYLKHTDAHGGPLPLGTFGPATVQAVKAFQRDQHITPVNGMAGPKTLDALHKAIEKQHTQQGQPQSAFSLQPGFSTGDPDLDRLAAALFSKDDAAFSRVSAEIAQSPKVQAMVRDGHASLAAAQQVPQQAQAVGRRGPAFA